MQISIRNVTVVALDTITLKTSNVTRWSFDKPPFLFRDPILCKI